MKFHEIINSDFMKFHESSLFSMKIMELPKCLQGVHGTAYKFSRKYMELPTFRVKFQREVVRGEILFQYLWALLCRTQFSAVLSSTEGRNSKKVSSPLI